MAFNSSTVLNVIRNFQRYSRCRPSFVPTRHHSTTKVLCELTDRPVTYSTTKAYNMTAAETFNPKPNPAAFKFERHIIALSCFVLLVYCVFIREENKIDEILGGTFRYEEDDEIKLVNALLHAKLNGVNTQEIEEKLKKIRGQI